MNIATSNLSRLERVNLREVWLNEASDFTPWLAREENIALLGDAIELDLEVEAKEKEVGPFRADILCKDTASDHWVLIENQLERTDHTHLGQLITYAAGLNAVTIVWIAERFTDEHRAALDWLNEATAEDINFFGLEIELWRIANSPVAPKFNVVWKPNDWTRSAGRSKTGEVTETKRLQLEYWTGFRRVLSERHPSIRGTKPRPQNWNRFSIGRSDFSLLTFANTRDKRIGIEVVCRGENAKPHFYLLQQQKDAIESQLQLNLDWRELPDGKGSRITFRRAPTDPAARDRWPEQHQWLADTLRVFHDVFSERVRHLDADIYQPTVADELGDLADEDKHANPSG